MPAFDMACFAAMCSTTWLSEALLQSRLTRAWCYIHTELKLIDGFVKSAAAPGTSARAAAHTCPATPKHSTDQASCQQHSVQRSHCIALCWVHNSRSILVSKQHSILEHTRTCIALCWCMSDMEAPQSCFATETRTHVTRLDGSRLFLHFKLTNPGPACTHNRCPCK